jgi:L-arabinose isomerase
VDRPLVAIPYWGFFERSTADDLRASRARLLTELREALGERLASAEELWIDSMQAGLEAARRFAGESPSAVLVLQTMAVPPTWTLALLDALPETAVLVAAIQVEGDADAEFDHAAIVERGATVGGTQLGNLLVRRGRPFRAVAGTIGSGRLQARLREELDAAVAVGKLRQTRLLRLGRPLEGYACVDCDNSILEAALGLEIVELEPAALRDAYREVDDEATAALREEVAAGWHTSERTRTSADFGRSLRLAVALERLAARHGAGGGALNCHVEEIRLGPEPGVAPCFGLGRETSAGRPWTCTGDIVTAVAMLALKLLGAPAWYHEIEALDTLGDEALLACSGEHDLGLAPAGAKPELRQNPWWNGVCACFTPSPGPASLVGFTPAAGARGGFRFLVAEGAFGARQMPETGTVNAGFDFERGAADVCWERWASCGATHHAAAASGHRGEQITALAEHLDLECVVI